MTDTTPLTRQVGLDEAAHILGLSRRTVQRRLADGTLQGRKDGPRWLVDVPVAGHDAPAVGHDQDTRAIDTLRAQVTALAQERDTLARQLDTTTEDRDYLRQALAAALTLQKQLPAPGDTAQPSLETVTSEPRRPWWQFWR